MRLHKVVDTTTGIVKAYAGSETAARHARQSIFQAPDASLRRKDLDIQQVEVPTGKDALIAFLNANAVR